MTASQRGETDRSSSRMGSPGRSGECSSGTLPPVYGYWYGVRALHRGGVTQDGGGADGKDLPF